LQDGMSGHVPCEQAVDDGTTEAHLLAGLGVCVERVVVAVQAVEMRRLHRGLSDACSIGDAVGGWVVGYFGTCKNCVSILLVMAGQFASSSHL
jgi:hypothetical protein